MGPSVTEIQNPGSANNSTGLRDVGRAGGGRPYGDLAEIRASDSPLREKYRSRSPTDRILDI